HFGIPASDELFDARHIDRTVMQVLLDSRQVCRKEAAIGANGVAAEWHGTFARNVFLDECERGVTRFIERDGGSLDEVEEAGLGMHVDDEGVHAGEYVVALV